MWNYRLVKSKDVSEAITLSEVHYDDDGAPLGFCDATTIGDDVDEARDAYDMMKEAFDNPVIDEKDILFIKRKKGNL